MIRMSTILRDNGLFVSWALDGRGSAYSSLQSVSVQPMRQKLTIFYMVESTSMLIV